MKPPETGRRLQRGWRRLCTCIAVGVVPNLAMSPSRADFVIAVTPDQRAESSSSTDDARRFTKVVPSRAREILARVGQGSGFPLAQGFGTRVPLRFAIQQIVPRQIKVTYGPGADPNDVVTWTGGQEWNVVLSHAVRQLGLRLQMAQSSVEIRK